MLKKLPLSAIDGFDSILMYVDQVYTSYNSTGDIVCDDCNQSILSQLSNFLNDPVLQSCKLEFTVTDQDSLLKLSTLVLKTINQKLALNINKQKKFTKDKFRFMCNLFLQAQPGSCDDFFNTCYGILLTHNIINKDGSIDTTRKILTKSEFVELFKPLDPDNNNKFVDIAYRWLSSTFELVKNRNYGQCLTLGDSKKVDIHYSLKADLFIHEQITIDSNGTTHVKVMFPYKTSVKNKVGKSKKGHVEKSKKGNAWVSKFSYNALPYYMGRYQSKSIELEWMKMRIKLALSKDMLNKADKLYLPVLRNRKFNDLIFPFFCGSLHILRTTQHYLSVGFQRTMIQFYFTFVKNQGDVNSDWKIPLAKFMDELKKRLTDYDQKIAMLEQGNHENMPKFKKNETYFVEQKDKLTSDYLSELESFLKISLFSHYSINTKKQSTGPLKQLFFALVDTSSYFEKIQYKLNTVDLAKFKDCDKQFFAAVTQELLQHNNFKLCSQFLIQSDRQLALWVKQWFCSEPIDCKLDTLKDYINHFIPAFSFLFLQREGDREPVTRFIHRALIDLMMSGDFTIYQCLDSSAMVAQGACKSARKVMEFYQARLSDDTDMFHGPNNTRYASDRNYSSFQDYHFSGPAEEHVEKHREVVTAIVEKYRPLFEGYDPRLKEAVFGQEEVITRGDLTYSCLVYNYKFFERFLKFLIGNNKKSVYEGSNQQFFGRLLDKF
tara:strand:+ start:86 stop:2239 length:2154 start_codon:yes stop_codon:yes gene_type:complete